MDIVIYGTKGGYTVFTPKKLRGLLDVTADSAQAPAIGKEAYAIRFTADNAIFSKYRIIRDVRGDKRTGFVGFSLFLPKDEKLSGADIISLLDKVSDNYCKLHAPDNNLGYTVEENWDFLDAVLRPYESKPKYDEEMQSGSKDDAFVYFRDSDELKRYFDAPVQEEYSDYRQILFVKEELRNQPENPLNALRNSKNNLTGQIDLENPYYYLTDYNSSNRVFIHVWKDESWQPRSDKKDNCIRAKEQIVIQYSKDERYYEPIKEEGTLFDPKIQQYVEVSENRIKIKYDAFKPNERIQTVFIEVKEGKSNQSTSGAEIRYQKDGQQPQTTEDYAITFIGEEIGKSCSVLAEKGANVYSKGYSFIPAQQTENVDLILEKHTKVTFQVVDDKGPVLYYNIEIRDKQGNFFDRGKEFEFIGESIDKTFDITVSSNKHEDETFTYCPATDDNPKSVTLKNRDFGHRNPGRDDRKKKIYGLKIDEKRWKRLGDIDSIKAGVSDSSDLPDVNPRWGYKFVGWSLHEESWECYGIQYDGYYKAHFDKRWYRKIPKWSRIVGGIAIIALAVAIVFTVKDCRTNNTEQSFDESEIQRYVEGDAIFPDRLKIYQTDWENQKPEIKKEGGSGWSAIRAWWTAIWTDNKEEKRDSTDYQKWEAFSQRIQYAITLRQWVDETRFAELKDASYSLRQNKFKEAVKKIEPADFEAVKQQLGDVSNLTLNQIADTIHAIVKEMEEAQSKQEVENEAEQENKPAEPKPQVKQEPAARPPEKPAAEPVQQPTSTNDRTPEIIYYLKSGELKKSRLEAYKLQAPSPNLTTSIELALKFWKLDGTTNNSYSSYQKELANDNLRDNKELTRFVDSMCEKEKPKYVKDLSEEDQDQNLSHIISKLK